MNQWIGMGRLTRDPEMRVSQTNNQMSIAKFSLAVDRRYSKNGEKETDFFNITAFGKLAEFCDRYLKQGTKVIVIGELQNNNYTNKEGQKVYSVNIVASSIEFAESKKAESQPETQNTDSNEWMSIPDGISEELPFN